ncbi:uncharacterized protein LOC122647210 [Telopea speciosissima]|uniref:uncharacterized protein LOC122647210 n=1 Tax=Telopea speciosissima TaxID=54955 RepID=UPI001CC5F10A|nr:uncharacterized protein LOC122647210 [Telopea speciosissima]
MSSITPVLEKASKAVWELILDDKGLGKEISETVERVYCRLSGQEPPLLLPNTDAQSQMEEEKDNSDSSSKSKKRSYSEMSIQGRENEIVDGSGNSPSLPEGSGVVPPSNVQT